MCQERTTILTYVFRLSSGICVKIVVLTETSHTYVNGSSIGKIPSLIVTPGSNFRTLGFIQSRPTNLSHHARCFASEFSNDSTLHLLHPKRSRMQRKCQILVLFQLFEQETGDQVISIEQLKPILTYWLQTFVCYDNVE